MGLRFSKKDLPVQEGALIQALIQALYSLHDEKINVNYLLRMKPSANRSGMFLKMLCLDGCCPKTVPEVVKSFEQLKEFISIFFLHFLQ